MPTLGLPTPNARSTTLPSLAALWCLLATGCSQIGNEAPAEIADLRAAPAAAVAAVPPPADPVAVAPDTARSPAAVATADVREASPAPVLNAPLSEVAPVEGASPSPSPVDLADAALPLQELPAAEPVVPLTAASAAAVSFASPPRAAGETLDFKALVTRLRKTKAINLSAKLSVKNLSDDLLDDFRDYHARRGTADLDDLRRSYDSLFQRLHSLLHDADPLLDRDIDRSRAALWDILADPRKFTAAKLMTGA